MQRRLSIPKKSCARLGHESRGRISIPDESRGRVSKKDGSRSEHVISAAAFCYRAKTERGLPHCICETSVRASRFEAITTLCSSCDEFSMSRDLTKHLASLFVYLYACPSICPAVLFVSGLSVCLSACGSVHSSARPSVRPVMRLR